MVCQSYPANPASDVLGGSYETDLFASAKKIQRGLTAIYRITRIREDRYGQSKLSCESSFRRFFWGGSYETDLFASAKNTKRSDRDLSDYED